MIPFRNLNFGYARAETERTEDPGLLKEHYFDELGYANKALDGPVFLFLGYKGAGKSALINHLDLEFQDKYNQFSSIYQLEDFSFQNFSKIVRGDIEPEAKYPDAWAWILLILSMDILYRNESISHPDLTSFIEAVNSLRSMGFLPNSTLRHIANLTSKKSFQLNIPYVFNHSEEYIKIDKLNDIPLFVENMKRLIKQVRTDSTHVILIDGMDDILTSRKIQYKSLGMLIFEIDRMNDFLKQNSVPLKFVVVCRTDLYEKISGANKNKIKQDKSLFIDWYKNPRNPEESLLLSMVNKKANVNNIMDYFPRRINGEPSTKFLLNHTRHTPRDFLALFKKISEVASDGATNITSNNVQSGIRLYSNDYFIGEVIDELDGYTENPKDWVEFLGSFGQRRIQMKEMEKRCINNGYNISDLHDVLNVLFECSAIGTVVGNGNSEHYTFKYRNRNSRFVVGNDISIHVGLRKALNIP